MSRSIPASAVEAAGGAVRPPVGRSESLPKPFMLDSEQLKRRIADLQLEHRGLDAIIEELGEQAHRDELRLRRLKKRKLQIKDTIALLQMQLVPDVPA